MRSAAARPTPAVAQPRARSCSVTWSTAKKIALRTAFFAAPTAWLRAWIGAFASTLVCSSSSAMAARMSSGAQKIYTI